jgi:hypothetical protein
VERAIGWVSRPDRHPVIVEGSAILSDSKAVRIKIVDISSGGCRVRTDEHLGIGDVVTLRIPPFEHMSAKVRWSLFGIAGLRFCDLPQ